MARSIKKGPYIHHSIIKKLKKVRESNKREVIKTWSRASMILPECVGCNFAVHDGRKHVPVFIVEAMVGMRLGEFAPTRTFHGHGADRKGKK